MNQAIIEKLKLFDLSIEIRFCPHKPENKCKCRKPNIGMVECDQRADKDIFIGDQITDMICAQNANIKHRWLINKSNSRYATRFALDHSIFLSKVKEWYKMDILEIY